MTSSVAAPNGSILIHGNGHPLRGYNGLPCVLSTLENLHVYLPDPRPCRSVPFMKNQWRRYGLSFHSLHSQKLPASEMSPHQVVTSQCRLDSQNSFTRENVAGCSDCSVNRLGGVLGSSFRLDLEVLFFIKTLLTRYKYILHVVRTNTLWINFFWPFWSDVGRKGANTRWIIVEG